MIIIVYISVAVIALAFLILVIYLARTLRSMQTTFQQVSSTIDSFDKQLKGITEETTSLLKKTNGLADDLQKKSEQLNTVIKSVEEFGGTISRVNSSMQEMTDKFMKQLDIQKDTFSKLVDVTHTAMEMWESLKEKRNQREDNKKIS
ncbi:DUF948 domain-containing protein [Bacillus sp. HMF5848]|uniref:DUF948 domain-containing protein n=1 Tax=Bacillus sp. HMF5848 TaxID=2495421 RepID=UPI000F76A7A0|nr:DUF948 domain-containing protein [Bacillus sp. HMF5848]RSK28206.1 DUF948 domain-containing protein [Bacillus sp. HMF5848]